MLSCLFFVANLLMLQLDEEKPGIIFFKAETLLKKLCENPCVSKIFSIIFMTLRFLLEASKGFAHPRSLDSDDIS